MSAREHTALAAALAAWRRLCWVRYPLACAIKDSYVVEWRHRGILLGYL